MAIQKEIWVKDIQDTLFEGSEFIMAGSNHDAFVDNKTVHVPQSGAFPNIAKNRSSLPATITQRTDTDLTYNLAEFTTDPILITDIDELQTSYAKRQSVLGQHSGLLNQRMGDEVANVWAPAGAGVLRTTGNATADLPNGTATGTRNLITKADISKMAQKLDADKVPTNDRYLVLPVAMYYELFADDSIVRKDFGQAGNMLTGVVNELYGFKIFKRATTVMYNNQATAVKKAIGSADASTDCLGAFAFQKQMVASALGSIKVFADEDKPEYYGSLFSALIMQGATVLRAGGVGVVGLAQGYTAP